MSSRRAVGEDNILAMLERDSARRTGGRISHLRLAWYGAAAALAGILAGGVAWLAYDNHKSGAQLQAGHDAALAQVPPAVSGAGAAAPPEAAASTLPAPAADAPRTAVIVDEPGPAPEPTPAVPPLVMLSPHEAAAAHTPRQAAPALPAPASRTVSPPVVLPATDAALPPRALARDRDKAPARAAAPARASRDTTGAAPPKARGMQMAAHAAIEKKADKTKTNKTRRTNVRGAKAAPPRHLARTPAEPGTRQRKANASEAPVDSDVALISAIIAQSERHRGERDAAAQCSGPKCPQKAAYP